MRITRWQRMKIKEEAEEQAWKRFKIIQALLETTTRVEMQTHTRDLWRRWVVQWVQEMQLRLQVMEGTHEQTMQEIVKLKAEMNAEEGMEEQYRKKVEEMAKNLAGTRMQAGVAEGLPLPRAKAKSNVGQMRKE